MSVPVRLHTPIVIRESSTVTPEGASTLRASGLVVYRYGQNLALLTLRLFS